MAAGSRDRVTVDLRGAGSVVQARAMAQGLTVAAFVRRAVMTIAEAPVDSTETRSIAPSGAEQRLIKVTLRLTADHALLLATRARSAEVSQGSYVAGLLDGQPPPRAASDRREAIAALAKSTDQLAVMSTDLQTVLRLIRTALTGAGRAVPRKGEDAAGGRPRAPRHGVRLSRRSAANGTAEVASTNPPRSD